MNFFFIVELSKEIGFGHLSRILSIFSLFNKSNSFLIVKGKEEEIKKLIKNIKYEVYSNSLIKKINKKDVIIIDVYKNKKILNVFSYFSNIWIIIDHDFDCENIPFKGIIAPVNYTLKLINKNPQTTYFKSEKYVLLKEDVINFPKSNYEKPSFSKIIISVGGSNLFDNVLEKLNTSLKEFFVLKIISNSFRKNSIKLTKNTKEYLKKIDQTDILICSGGQSLYEALYLGILCIPIGLTENQSKNIENLKKKGILKFKLNLDENIYNQLKEFIEFYSLRKNRLEYIDTTRKFIDGKGRKRVFSLINSLK